MLPADVSPPAICATVVEPTAEAVVARMHAVAPWCALIEVRLDALTTPPSEADLRRIVGARPRTLIVTHRPRREGGASGAPDDQRLRVLARAAALGAEWIDVEWDAADALPPLAPGARVVVSRHLSGGPDADLDRRPVPPADLDALLRSLRAARGDVQKLAVPVRSAEDALDLLERCARETRPTLAVALGPRGVVSRVAGTRWGAPWVYASADPDPRRAAAPGSLPAAVLALTLAGRTPRRPAEDPGPHVAGARPGGASIAGATSPTAGTRTPDAERTPCALFGVTGRSIAHSRSPALHNAAFAALGLDAVLSWLETDDPGALLAALERDPRALGLAVTLPHKTAFARLLEQRGLRLSDEARGAGAVNTVVRRGRAPTPPGRSRAAPDSLATWSGHNTDVLAAEDLLRRALAELGREPEWARIGIAGSGGSAHAVAYAAARLGAEVVVFARTPANARALGDAVHAAGAERSFWIRSGGSLFDVPTARAHDALHVIVNATPVGMNGDPLTPVPPDAFGPNVVAYDLVYTPPETPFLRHARARGARVVTGLEHFARQARAQVALWLAALERPPELLDALPLEWFEARARFLTGGAPTLPTPPTPPTAPTAPTPPTPPTAPTAPTPPTPPTAPTPPTPPTAPTPPTPPTAPTAPTPPTPPTAPTAPSTAATWTASTSATSPT